MAEKKDKTLLIVGVIAVAGIAAYFLLKPTEPEPPPTAVSATIDSFTISV